MLQDTTTLQPKDIQANETSSTPATPVAKAPNDISTQNANEQHIISLPSPSSHRIPTHPTLLAPTNAPHHFPNSIPDPITTPLPSSLPQLFESFYTYSINSFPMATFSVSIPPSPSTAIIPYPSLPLSHATCIATSDDEYDNTPSLVTSAYTWLTQMVSQTEANASPRFSQTRRVEFEGLISQGVFSISHFDEAKGYTIFNARFNDEIRHVETPHARYKSFLISQEYKDKVRVSSLMHQPYSDPHGM